MGPQHPSAGLVSKKVRKSISVAQKNRTSQCAGDTIPKKVCSCDLDLDLDLDLMTSIYKLDLHILKMYLHT